MTSGILFDSLTAFLVEPLAHRRSVNICWMKIHERCHFLDFVKLWYKWQSWNYQSCQYGFHWRIAVFNIVCTSYCLKATVKLFMGCSKLLQTNWHLRPKDKFLVPWKDISHKWQLLGWIILVIAEKQRKPKNPQGKLEVSFKILKCPWGTRCYLELKTTNLAEINRTLMFSGISIVLTYVKEDFILCPDS